MLLLIKAVDKRDTHTMSLFMTPTLIDGYVKQDGTVVAPHVARRPHAPDKHPATVATKQHELLKKEHNAPVNNAGAAMEAELKGIPAAVAGLPPAAPDGGPAKAEHWGPPNKRDVPDYLMPQVEAIIAKVNKRAAKLGVEGFTLVKGRAFDKRIPPQAGEAERFVSVVPVTIDGPTIKAPGGWKLAGRVDFEDGATIVNSKPGTELPARFRSIRPTCEHCNSDRQRNAVFVFSREGDDYMQVGRQCLKDYLGHDPAAALWAASEYGGVFDDIDRELDEDRASGGGRSQLVGLDDVMTAAAWAVREFGFTSRKAEEDSGGAKLATSSDVSGALFGKREREDYLKRVTESDKEKAAAVVAWVQSEWGDRGDAASDYEYNAVELTGRRAVHVRRIGLLTSLVAAYDRANEEKVAKEKRVNAYVGAVGERREFDAVYSGENWFDTAYGRMCIARFDTPEGLVVYKGNSPWWPDSMKAGDPIKFVGTIKAHDDYKGTKQTLVLRCAMPKEKPAKKAKA